MDDNLSVDVHFTDKSGNSVRGTSDSNNFTRRVGAISTPLRSPAGSKDVYCEVIKNPDSV